MSVFVLGDVIMSVSMLSVIKICVVRSNAIILKFL